MTLPLPDLDQRQWADLVAEARARIPRHAPEWTDHNIHDPGITLIELLAYTTEQALYRANRVTDALKRRFLALVGVRALPCPPRPARAPLAFQLEPVAIATLPAGVILVPAPLGDTDAPFSAPVRLVQPLTVSSSKINSIQTTDGRGRITDVSRPRPGATSFPAWGDDPILPSPGTEMEAPALVLGFQPPLYLDAEFSLRVEVASPDPVGDRERLRQELQDRADELNKLRSRLAKKESAASEKPGKQAEFFAEVLDPERGPLPANDRPPTRVSWEFFDQDMWRELEFGDQGDSTRGLTLDGTLTFRFPARSDQRLERVAGHNSPTVKFVRCRLVEGIPDAPPRITRLEVHAAMVEQSVPVLTRLQPIHLSGTRNSGKQPQVRLGLLAEQLLGVSQIQPGPSDHDCEAYESLVPVAESGSDRLIVPLDVEGPTRPNADGSTRVALRDAPIVVETLRVVTVEPLGDGDSYALRAWTRCDSLDSLGPYDPGYEVDASVGQLRFGDGRRGRALPRGSFILAAMATTRAARGDLPARRPWFVPGLSPLPRRELSVAEATAVSDYADWNRSLSGLAPSTGGNNARSYTPYSTLTAFSGDRIAADVARGGADAELLADAVARLARSTQAATELARVSRERGGTLDGMSRIEIRSLEPPIQAVVASDIERLAIETPGASIRRARAFDRFDPVTAPLPSPGSLTLAIMPELPRTRPEPSANLVQRVKAYLDGRRILGSHVHVVGPHYVDVAIQATVLVAARVNGAAVRERAESELQRWLDPIAGGPAAVGWPFGQIPRRAEVLARLGDVEGIVAVVSLDLEIGPWPRLPWTLPTLARIALGVETS